MTFERAHRNLFVLFGLFVLATYVLAATLSHGVLVWGGIAGDYARGFLAVTAISVPLLLLWHLFAAMREKKRALDRYREKLGDISFWAWLAIPALMAPVFLASFTVMKTLIGMRLGFGWDEFFADLDRAIFGTDPWQITHAVAGSRATIFLQFCYVVWGGEFAFSVALVPLLTRRTYSAHFLLAMFLTWLVTGLLFASLFSSAGPVFAHLFDPDLDARFRPMRAGLNRLLAEDRTILIAQAYLAKYWNYSTATRGGGISAFPSVHVAVAVLYILASWRILWLRIAAIAFAIFIWIGSVHFGFHYAVDGIAALIIVPICWFVAGRAVHFTANRHVASDRLRSARVAASARQPGSRNNAKTPVWP